MHLTLLFRIQLAFPLLGENVREKMHTVTTFTNYWAAYGARPVQLQFRFSVVCAEKRSPRGGKTRGLAPRSDVLIT